MNLLKEVFFFFLNIGIYLNLIYILQPTILNHTNVRTSKISQKKSDLWSLLKDLNSELQDKQYLIEV